MFSVRPLSFFLLPFFPVSRQPKTNLDSQGEGGGGEQMGMRTRGAMQKKKQVSQEKEIKLCGQKEIIHCFTGILKNKAALQKLQNSHQIIHHKGFLDLVLLF